MPQAWDSADQPDRPVAAARRQRGRPKGLTVKTISLVCAATVVIIAGMISIGPTGASVAASVKAFLFDWETRDYTDAASLTTGQPAVVKAALRAAFRQLGAEDLVLTMGPISVGSHFARASFGATIDLGRGLPPWQYNGHFRLRRAGSGWLVVWSPSVIAPGLGVHDRLAVITTMPGRARLLDAVGQPLFRLSWVYQIGVYPDEVRHPALTAAELARATNLGASAGQMRGLIQASPPDKFLSLIQLYPARFQQLRGKLHKIQGVRVITVRKRLFRSTVPDITGQIGTETAPVIASEGEPYRPGTTVGEAGLEQEYQAQLAGTPTTEVIVQNSRGKLVRVLRRWSGRGGTQVRTTIDSGVQLAAQRALTGLSNSAAIVAIRAGGGQILGVASRKAADQPAVSPLDGRYQPAQTFTMVSTAALLTSVPGFAVSNQVPCKLTNPIDGQTFTNVPAGMKFRSPPPFSVDFTNACNTAFVGLSLRLSPSALVAAAKGFGFGGPPWRLPLPSTGFVGSFASPGVATDEAADVIGTGSVRASPLDMALAAGVIDSGAWLPPSLVRASGPRPQPRVTFTHQVISRIQGLMRTTVRSGAAGAAYRPGGATLYGQVGTARLGYRGLWVNWFVGFRGNVAFAVVMFSHSARFDQAASIAGHFAASLPAQSLGQSHS